MTQVSIVVFCVGLSVAGASGIVPAPHEFVTRLQSMLEAVGFVLPGVMQPLALRRV